jgi:hypothetical protein
MKSREGFVSNSSSTCYILDLCDKETETIVRKLQKSGILDLSAPTAASFSRCTCYGVGKAVREFAIEQEKDFAELYESDEEDSFSKWLYNAMEQLGEVNTVFIRVSDEDHGIPVELKPELIYAEREYH